MVTVCCGSVKEEAGLNLTAIGEFFDFVTTLFGGFMKPLQNPFLSQRTPYFEIYSERLFEANPLSDAIAQHLKLLEASSDAQVICDSQNAACRLINTLATKVWHHFDLPFERIIVLSFLLNYLEVYLCKKTRQKLEGIYTDLWNNKLIGYCFERFECQTFPNKSGVLWDKETACTFLEPCFLSNNYFLNQLNSVSRYTKRRVAANFLLIAMFADKIDHVSNGIEFNPQRYLRYQEILTYGNRLDRLLEIVGCVPVISNLIIPSLWQTDIAVNQSYRKLNYKWRAAAGYYSQHFVNNFPRDEKTLFESVLRYTVFKECVLHGTSGETDLFGSETLFGLLDMYYSKTLCLNQFARSEFFSIIYPALLATRDSKRPAPTFETRNWDFMNNASLQRILAE
jgi:hypothetical protein